MSSIRTDVERTKGQLADAGVQGRVDIPGDLATTNSSPKQPSATAMSEPYQRISRKRSERGAFRCGSSALLVCMTCFIPMFVLERWYSFYGSIA